MSIEQHWTGQKKSGVLEKTALVFGQMNEPPGARMRVAKPWHYEDCRLKQYFWKYAEQTTVIDEIRHELETYPQEKKDQDALGAQKLVKTAIEETNRPDNWLNRQTLIHKIGKRVRSFIEKPDGKCLIFRRILWIKSDWYPHIRASMYQV